MSHWIENENFLLERKRGKRGIPVSFYKGPNSSWAQYSDFPWPLCSLQCDLGGFRGHKMTRSTHDGLLDNTVGTAQSCKVSARASKSANIVMGCLLLCPVGCQNSANCFGLRCAKEVMAKYSTVGTIINYILITHRYEYIHTSSMFTGSKWLGCDEVYFQIFFKYKHIHLKNYHLPFYFFQALSYRENYHRQWEKSWCTCPVYVRVMFNMRYTFNNNLKLRYSKEYILPYPLLCFPFYYTRFYLRFWSFNSNQFMIQVLALTHILCHLQFRPSICISSSSQHYVAKIYLDFCLPSPFWDLSEVTGSRLWVPIQLDCVRPCRNHRGGSCRNTEITTAVCRFWLIKNMNRVWKEEKKKKSQTPSFK